MKNFFKTTLAVFVALILFSVVSGIISVAMLGAFAAIGTAETQLKENSVLEIKLSGTLTERVSEDLFELEAVLLTIDETQPTPLGLNNLRSSIKKATNADEIKGAIHSNFLFVKKMTVTVRTGITPNIKTFHQSILYLLFFLPCRKQIGEDGC